MEIVPPAKKSLATLSDIEIPYATKLMFQELMAINILPRIKVKENEFIDGV
jgi:DNA-directed RNA polymerase beta subunit